MPNCIPISSFNFLLFPVLLTLRLVALYKRRRWVCWFLYTFLIVSYIIATVLMVLVLRIFGCQSTLSLAFAALFDDISAVTLQYSPILHVCGSTTRSSLMPIIFIVPSAFEFVLFFLTGFRAWQDAKIMTSSASAPLLHVFYRDGIICFFVMFGVRIWNIWIVRPIYTFNPFLLFTIS
jgi:hypothetical protein